MADPVLDVKPGALASCGMRYHELALQRWLNRKFITKAGYAVPVVMSSPMDAFSEFTRLWNSATNPYRYVFDAKDDKGQPVGPYPSPPIYPILSVYRKNYKLRPSQNFSIHRMRHIAWPTVSDSAPYTPGKSQQGTDLQLGDMGNVATSRYPMAIDYRFQLDFFSNRPDTQAFFLADVFREFWRTGGSEMQTWITVGYPVLGNKLVRLYVDGDIENTTPEVPEEDKNVEFRVSFTVVIEGFEIDVNYQIHPVLWELLLRSGAAVPASISQAMDFTGDMDFTSTVDMRGESDGNPTVVYRSKIAVMPSSGTYAPDTNEIGS